MTFLCMVAHRKNTEAHTFYHHSTMLMSVSVKNHINVTATLVT